MNDYIDISEDIVAALAKSFRQGPIMDNNRRLLTEASYDFIYPHIKVSTFSKENEPPHFRLDYQQQNCRYDLFSGEPIDPVPRDIKKYSKNIRIWYDEHKEDLIAFYKEHLADDAPPQSKVHH